MRLTPRIGPELRRLLDRPALLRQLVGALGSPLNVVLPDRIAATVDGFRSVYRERHLSGTIHYAHKANRSAALVRRLAATDAGIDVASLAELQHALGAGFTPDRVIATGPKTREFLWLAARTGALVSADSLAELTELAAIVRAHRLPRVRVLARLSGFETAGVRTVSRRSRFGIPAGEVAAVLGLLDEYAVELELTGVAYHVDTVGLPEKVAAFDGCLAVLDECHRRGFRPRALDIGGGFGVRYLADGAEWDAYTTGLADAVLGKRPPVTWNGHGYGLRTEAGRLRGTLAVHPGHRPLAGPDYLGKLLDTESPTLRRPLGDLLLDGMYDLLVEPGRALLDQCGAVLTTVREVRAGPDGVPLVGLDLNARDVSLEEHGVLMDPVLVSSSPGGGEGPVGVYLLGNLCLEADLVTRRQVFLPRVPRPGDLLAFVNTAGYLMDFSAGHALMQPAARTVALSEVDGEWQWCLDDAYWPVRGREAA